MTLPTNGTITQYFDTPVNYIAGRTTHEALDIVTVAFEAIHAPFSGIVQLVLNTVPNYEKGWTGYGNEIWLVSYNGRVKSRFAHCMQQFPVTEGEVIEAGTQIATTGQTGYRFPLDTIHTHWEIYLDGVRVDPLGDDWVNALDQSLTLDDMSQLQDLEDRVSKLESMTESLKKRKASKDYVDTTVRDQVKSRTKKTRQWVKALRSKVFKKKQ